MPPRYFTARASSPGSGSATAEAPGDAVAATATDALPISHPLDVFVLEAPHTQAVEWVVGFDDLGRLAAQPFAAAAAAPPVRAQLSFHEVAGGSRRLLRAAELYLYELALVEQAADSPGFDDPVHLYGTLLGPLAPGAPLARSEGQLTVTRADVLEAAARGAAHAFRYAAPGGGTAGARAFHLLLPGDRPEELAQGRGVVLAYPVLSADVQAAAPGNEFFFNQIMYDVIAGLWSDVQREAPPPRRRPEDLPVPSRALAEQRLVSDGYVIEGDMAVRPRKGLLGSVLGALVDDRRPVPTEGQSDDYVRLAQEALGAVTGWPAPRARALRACLGPGGGSPLVPVFAGVQAPFAVPPPPPPPPPRRPAGPPAWMEDFIASHRRPGARPPVVTSAGPPAWMSDFAPGAPAGAATGRDQREDARAGDTQSDTSPPRPDWMKDFDP